MAGIDFPKMENRAPEIYISLHLNVKLAATDDKRRNVSSNFYGKSQKRERKVLYVRQHRYI